MAFVEDAPANCHLRRAIEYTSTAHRNEPMQWCGWRKSTFPSQWWMRVSCWIKFIGAVPPPSDNFGLKLHGKVDNSWLSQCEPDTWTRISSMAPCSGGDGGHVLLIFDSIAQPQRVRFTALELEVWAVSPPEWPA